MNLGRATWPQYFEEKQLKICILGGGNIGTLLLSDLGAREDVSTRLFTSRPHQWSREIKVYNADDIVKHTGKLDMISDNPRDVVADSNIIISSLPSHVFPIVIEKIKPFVDPGAWVGLMPGSGGREFYCNDLVTKGCTLFGFQRVHGIARIREYGRSVYDLGKKQELHMAALPTRKIEEVCTVMEDLLGIKCYPLPNYLNVTLTPSNPILHTTRLYSMFRDYCEGIYWDKVIHFYEEWTDEASEFLIDCDEELQAMCRKVTELNLTGVKSLREHYESDTPEMMTRKLGSIIAFKGIKTPMIQTKNGYVPDFKSRYFVEDFPYGLCVIKGFCDVVGSDTPTIDRILMWFEKIAGVNYYANGKFAGDDLKCLPLPKNHDLNTAEDIVSYYGQNRHPERALRIEKGTEE